MLSKPVSNFFLTPKSGEICNLQLNLILRLNTQNNGDFRTVSPPITAFNGNVMIMDGKYSEIAFKNCL